MEMHGSWARYAITIICTACRDLTVEFLRSTGFQDPLLVRAEEGLSDTRKVYLGTSHLCCAQTY